MRPSRAAPANAALAGDRPPLRWAPSRGVTGCGCPGGDPTGPAPGDVRGPGMAHAMGESAAGTLRCSSCGVQMCLVMSLMN